MDLIDIAAASGSAQAHIARPPSGRGPGVILFMDAIGVRPRIADMAQRIADWGYVVLSPNVFYRFGSVDDVMPHDDLRQPGARDRFFEEVGPRIRSLTTEVVAPDLDAYVSALGELKGVTGDSIGTVGYCMGARLAVLAACRHPDSVVAAAGFHGGLVSPEPDSPHHQLGDARAEFVFGHADNDRAMPPEAVEQLGRALTDAGLRAVNEVYAGAAHGFTMADTSEFDSAATERSFSALHDLLARTLTA